MIDCFGNWKKAALAPLFFVLLGLGGVPAQAEAPSALDVPQLQALATALHLENDPVWLSLLHVEHGKPRIQGEEFLLSAPEFSPAREVNATIAALWGGQSDAVCQFPARYYWLRDRLGASDLPLEKCADVAEFLLKASDDNIDLVFVADNLSSPSSMLGHSFLKFSGMNGEGNISNHAVSFYTNTKTKNIPKLIFESFITGRRGYFSLTPYEQNLDLYLRGEKRKVWEYHLNLDESRRRLISLHVLELKRVPQTYFYIGYNCATVVRFLIQLSGGGVPAPTLWTTPRDVIYAADRAGLIDRSQVHYPQRALVRALSEGVSAGDQLRIRDAVQSGDVGSLGSDARLLQLAQAENNYAQEQGRIGAGQAQNNAGLLNERLAIGGIDGSLFIDPRIDPRKGRGERQLSLQVGVEDGEAAVRLSFLPASHLLIDENQNSSNETELKLFALTIEKKRNGAPTLRELTFFSMKTFVPRDRLTGGVSGRFSFGFDTQVDEFMKNRHPFVIDGGVGLTSRISADIDVYAMIGGGVGLLKLHPYAYVNAQAGMIIREVWGLKTTASLTSNLSSITQGTQYQIFQLSQAKHFQRNISLVFEWNRSFNEYKHRDSAFFSIKKSF